MRDQIDTQISSFVKLLRKLFHYTPIHRLRITNFLYKKWVDYMTHGKKEILLDFRNSHFLVPAKDITILPGLLTGGYEQLELDIFQRLIKNGDTIIDIGANIGVYSILGSKIVGNKGKIIGFEPESTNFGYLKRNLKINGCKNIQIENKAVGEKNGKAKLFLSEDSIGSHTMAISGNSGVEVSQISIDNYLKNKHLKPDFIKIDVEGYEPKVLLGLSRTIDKYRPTIFMEYVPVIIRKLAENTFTN